jgi:SOS-response transcriptional repressor LexA
MNTMGINQSRRVVLDFRRDFSHAKLDAMPLLGEVQRKLARSRAAQEREVALLQTETLSPCRVMTGMNPVHLVYIPLLGTIAAGYPSDQEEQSERCISIDEDTLQLPRNARTFALEVRGDSMVDAHIIDGDVVILELRDPTHRDIVAALIDGETTLKRFLVQKGKPFLRAENAKYPDLIPAHELVIQGVFRALLRVDKRRL